MGDEARTPRTRSEVSDRIDVIVNKLDDLAHAIYAAYDTLDQAQVDWDEKFDLIGEELRDQYREAGRKTDPSKDTITSVARKRYPAEYRTWRRAKDEIARLEQLSSARRSELSGLQTELREKGSGDQSGSDRRGLPQHARRRASV